jgi:hypothetical protein
MSSTSFCASTCGERVGFQSSCSAPEPGYHCPRASTASTIRTSPPITIRVKVSMGAA